MRTIKVDPGYVNVPGYSSASEAISAEMNTSRAKRSAIDSPRIAGNLVRDFEVSGQAISMSLSNGLFLEIALTDKQVEWQISEVQSNRINARQNGPPLRLLWPSGTESVLDPGSLLNARLHLPLRMIFAGQIFVNIYFKGGGALQFLPLWNQSDQISLLYACELEPVNEGSKNGQP